MAILYPTSLVNLVVEVGTRYCHQILLPQCLRAMQQIYLQVNHMEPLGTVYVYQKNKMNKNHQHSLTQFGKWRHRSESTLAHVMACCLMAPSHYLNNQCWIIMKGVLWHSPLKIHWNYPRYQFEKNRLCRLHFLNSFSQLTGANELRAIPHRLFAR